MRWHDMDDFRPSIFYRYYIQNKAESRVNAPCQCTRVLNLRTGHISPQFHCVFDDKFACAYVKFIDRYAAKSAADEISEWADADSKFFEVTFIQDEATQ